MAKAVIAFDQNGTPYFQSKFGIAGHTFTVDKIHLEPDMTGLLGPDAASTAAQLTVQPFVLEKANAFAEFLRCSPGTKPGEMIFGMITPGGGTVAWAQLNVLLLAVEYRIIDLGPTWPTSS